MLFKPTVVTLRGVNGNLFTLTDETFSGASILLQPGAKGLDAPTYDTKADEYPAIDGGFYRFARAGIREMFLPLKIMGSNRAQMMELKRRFIASLDPRRGLVSLQVTEYGRSAGQWVAGTPRAISGYYVSGMEGGEGSDGNYYWGTYGLVLRAPNPYFRHPSRTVGSFLSIDVLRPFFGPAEGNFLSLDGQTPGQGFQLSSNPVWVDSLDLDNAGEIETQPRWEIRGPLSSRMSIVRRDDSGTALEELRFNEAVTLNPDQVLVIETTKGSQSVRRYLAQGVGTEYDPRGGSSMWWALDVSSPMWALQPGLNHVALVIDKPAGMTPEEEATWTAGNEPNVTVSYFPTFLGI